MGALTDIQAKKLGVKKALRDALELIAAYADTATESGSIGTLSTLTTTVKNTLVAAINELDGELGVLSTLDTTVKTTIVAALNELVALIGDESTLDTTEKTEIVAAINEVVASVALNTGKVGAAATPVDGVQSTVTIDMTNGDADLTYTAVAHGVAGDDITVTHADPAGNDQALAVTVDGNDITVSLATDGSGVITSTANEVKAEIEAVAAAAALVTVTVEGAGTGVVEAKAETSLANGVDVTAGEIGSLRIDDTNIYMKLSEQVWKKVAHAGL